MIIKMIIKMWTIKVTKNIKPANFRFRVKGKFTQNDNSVIYSCW